MPGLEKVGEDSYISKLTLEAKATKTGEQSEMIRSINKLVKVVGFLIIPIGIILFYQQYVVVGDTFRESITSMVAAIIGMIPEGLYLLTSIALAASVIRLSLKKVLVHDMKCIETLARVNVLCVDKTGTITENTMKVNELCPLPPYDPKTMEPLEELVSDFAAAMSKDNITMAALQEYFVQPGGMKPVSITSFSSAFKYSSATFSTGSYVLGAPEFVLREDYDVYREQIESKGALGLPGAGLRSVPRNSHGKSSHREGYAPGSDPALQPHPPGRSGNFPVLCEAGGGNQGYFRRQSCDCIQCGRPSRHRPRGKLCGRRYPEDTPGYCGSRCKIYCFRPGNSGSETSVCKGSEGRRENRGP